MAQYPQDVAIEASIHSLEQITADDFASRRALLNTLVPDQQNVRDYIRGTVNGMFTSEGIIIDPHTLADITLLDTASIGTLTVIAQADYERITGQALSLADDECLLLCSGMDYSAPTFTLQGSQTLRVRQVLPDEANLRDSSLSMYPGVTLITPDFDGIIAHLTPSIDPTASGLFVTLHWCYSFDTPSNAEMQLSLYDLLMNHMRELAFPRETGSFSYGLSIREMERISFYGTYGGLFFIGILLSIVFISAAVLIIYYKQLSEGYEDQQRFSIMQKVGMTQKEIRRSINSQVLTVFFAPLLMAGLHLAFAFPIVWKLLQLFYLSNKGLMIAVTACSFAVFGALYALIYKVTSNTYYAIVSGVQEKQ